MATKKISELQELETLNNNDLIPVVDTENESTKKVTFRALGAASSMPTGSIIGYDGNTIPGGYEEININSFDTATQSANGLMSSADKTKLDNIMRTNQSTSINLNSIPDGIRLINGWSTSTITNLPSNVGWGILIQNSNQDGTLVVQFYLNTSTANGGICSRYKQNNTWTAWKTLS